MKTDKKLYSLMLHSTTMILFLILISSTASACDEYTLQVSTSVENTDNFIYLSDTKNSLDGGSDNFIPATIDITVLDQDGEPVPEMAVVVTAVAKPGSGGHQFHKSNTVQRPVANLEVDPNLLLYKSATYNQGDRYSNCNDITVITDSSGKVQVVYTPPAIPTVPLKKEPGDLVAITRVVAGTDIITVKLLGYPEIKTVKEINVGYKGFVKFKENENVTLKPQNNHGMEFWCTENTSKSIQDIADKYKASTGKPLNITAMSLKYGGLLDIDGTWNVPHASHSNGKCVDITKTSMSDKEIKEVEKLFKNDNNKRRNKVYNEDYCLHLSFET